jgi:hypothetical protein
LWGAIHPSTDLVQCSQVCPNLNSWARNLHQLSPLALGWHAQAWRSFSEHWCIFKVCGCEDRMHHARSLNLYILMWR